MTGNEDKYSEYKGCAHCKCPLEGQTRGQFHDDTNKGCPHCGAKDRTGAVSGDSITYLQIYTPQAEVDPDGALIIKQGWIQIGYYASGAWVSWRSE